MNDLQIPFGNISAALSMLNRSGKTHAAIAGAKPNTTFLSHSHEAAEQLRLHIGEIGRDDLKVAVIRTTADIAGLKGPFAIDHLSLSYWFAVASRMQDALAKLDLTDIG